MYRYGMRARGYSPWCQPTDNLLGIEKHETYKVSENGKEYYDILIYSEELPDEDVRNYQLDYLGVKK